MRFHFSVSKFYEKNIICTKFHFNLKMYKGYFLLDYDDF